MRHTRVALYDITTGSFDEIVDRAKSGMVPLFQDSPGFVSYGVAKIDNAAFVSVSTWETGEQANMATTKAADWVLKNLSDRMTLRRSYVGELAIDTEARPHAGLAR
jgi:hypothetical protein